MIVKKWMPAVLVLMLFLGCQSESQYEADRAPQGQTMDESKESGEEQKTEDAVERKLLKTGHITFESNNLQATKKQVLESIANNKGYVAADQEYKSSGRVSNSLTIRVPASNFDKLVAETTNGISRFDQKKIEVRDVTEEFVDTEARLKAKKELEARYLQLLKKANSVTELLEVEKQLGELRGKIESVEGRLKYLESKVSFATLHLTFYQQVPKETAFGIEFKNGFRNGWNNLIHFLLFLVNIWPFILLFGIALWGASRWRRRN